MPGNDCDLSPADADAHVVAASALLGMGRVDEAHDVLQEVGEIISRLALVYDRLGDIYRKKGFHQDAAVCYEKFISLHPGAEDADKDPDRLAKKYRQVKNACYGKINICPPEYQTSSKSSLLTKSMV